MHVKANEWILLVIYIKHTYNILYIYIYIYIYTYIYIHIHTYIHIYIYSCVSHHYCHFGQQWHKFAGTQQKLPLWPWAAGTSPPLWSLPLPWQGSGGSGAGSLTHESQGHESVHIQSRFRVEFIPCHFQCVDKVLWALIHIYI